MEKGNLLVLVLFIFLLGGCSSEEFEANQRKSEINISLIAPNGQRIAENLDDLTDLVAEVAENSYGENKDVEIDEIIYHETGYGFIAEVRYVTYDGFSNNLILANTSLKNDSNFNKIKTRAENGNGSVTIYSCKNNDSKKCPDCQIGRLSGGEIRCNCSKGERKYCELEEREG